jgi:hypothetical protein
MTKRRIEKNNGYQWPIAQNYEEALNFFVGSKLKDNLSNWVNNQITPK